MIQLSYDTNRRIDRIAVQALDHARCHNAMHLLRVIWPQTERIFQNLCLLIMDVIPNQDDDVPLLFTCMSEAKKNIHASLKVWRNGEIDDIDVLVNFVVCLVENAAELDMWRIIREGGEDWRLEAHGCLSTWWDTHKTDIVISRIDHEDGCRHSSKEIIKHRLIEGADVNYPFALPEGME